MGIVIAVVITAVVTFGLTWGFRGYIERKKNAAGAAIAGGLGAIGKKL
jgi:hypothetical protein